jgi:hypothetical protein
MKKIGVCFFALQVLLLAQCDMFQTSLETYLEEIPRELRLSGLRITSLAGSFTSLETLDNERSDYTIVATPGSTAYTLIAIPEDSSSVVTMPLLATPTRITIPSAELPSGLPSFWSYPPNETHAFTVQAANGPQKTYTVTIIWAELIDHPAKMRDDPAQDYYLRPGSPITLSAWAPIATTGFTGSLRGNGRTIIINSFLCPAAPNDDNHGLFAFLDNALIEDLHVHLNDTEVNAKWSGGIAGEADGSLIQRVRVSGGLWVNILGVTGTSIDAGGIVGHLSSDSLIYNSVSTVNVSADVYAGFTGDPYIGGINGAIDVSTGGNIVNCYATGTIDGTGHSNTRAGGINAGGGGNGVLKINYCVARNNLIKAGLPLGNANYVSAQWSNTLGVIGNLYWDGTNLVGIPYAGTTVPPSSEILTARRSSAELSNPATYTGMGWDFTNVWHMSGGLPALWWE